MITRKDYTDIIYMWAGLNIYNKPVIYFKLNNEWLPGIPHKSIIDRNKALTGYSKLKNYVDLSCMRQSLLQYIK
jgi:hypothetical protein